MTSANRLVVLQTYGRPVHLYFDGTRAVVCLGTGGHQPFFETYRVAEVVADRLERARIDDRPPLDLVTPLVCIQIGQFGTYMACWGVVDPIVATAAFNVPGRPPVDAAVGAGPRVDLGNASTDAYFLVQWPGSDQYTSWSVFDSCGVQLGLIAMAGGNATATPCAPRR